MKKLSLYILLILIICNISFADNLKIIDGDTIILNGEKIRGFRANVLVLEVRRRSKG